MIDPDKKTVTYSMSVLSEILTNIKDIEDQIPESGGVSSSDAVALSTACSSIRRLLHLSSGISLHEKLMPENKDGDSCISSQSECVLNKPLDTLEVTVYTRNALRREGFNKVSDLINIRTYQLLKKKSIGRKTLDDFVLALSKIGLKLDG